MYNEKDKDVPAVGVDKEVPLTDIFVTKYSRERDQGAIKELLAAHDLPMFPFDFLPENGFLAIEADRPIAAVLLFKTDSNFMQMNFPMTDPKASSHSRHLALSKLIDASQLLAKELGFKMLFTYSDSPGLIDRYQKHGFSKYDTGVTHLLWKDE